MNHRFFHAAAIAALGIATPVLGQSLADIPVTEDELRGHIAVLASDDFGGRFPGTAGETLSAHYIARAWAVAGFVGGADATGGWYQPVPLVEMRAGDSEARFWNAEGRPIAVPDILLRAPSGLGQINGAPLIFVGFGVDGSGQVVADVAGKVALVLANDRPGENPLSAAVRREALIAKGAVAILTVSPQGAPFGPIRRSYTNARMQLAGRVSRAQIEGVISFEAAQALLQANGVNLSEVVSAAAANDYTGLILPGKASLRAVTVRRDFNSYNVVARLPGARAGSGTVLVTGHWDHLGICRPEGAPDRICNGAVDNASGIAAMIAVAQRVAAGPRPDRDVIMIATTAEEQGLLGAYHFASNPTVPLPSIVIALNIDTVAVAPRGVAMAIVGRGTTPLTAEVDAVAVSLHRELDTDNDANAFVRRQDGWALTQAGVPSVMAGGGFTDTAYLQAFISGNYHTPADEMTDAVQLGGAADDADLHIALVRHFANLSSHPASHDQD
ncbi:MAG: M28 family peptidase [Pseudomonadota bacterium]